MRTSIIWSAVTILLLAATMAAPALPDQASLIAADQDDDDEDDNRGHGNDSDGHDEDNPGRGDGQDDDDDEDDNRGHGNDSDGHDEDNPGNGGDDDDERNGDASINVVNAGDYTVEVSCDFDAEANQTECAFTGAAPERGKDIGHIDLPEDAVCTDVIDGDYEFVDPDPNTGVTGYTSKGSDASLTLLLDGDVTVTGSTTYWFKVSGEVFPVTGPGLHCGDPGADATSQDTPTSGLASTPAVDTGTLVVNTYRCTDVPADTDSFDWFGACDPTGGEHEFTIARVDTETDDQHSEESGPSGSAAFDSLAAGTYQLEIVDTDWCHAESDNVTTNGDVVIDAGQTTTVWGFVCEDGAKQ